MKYLILLIGDGEMKPWDEQTEEEQEAVFAQHDVFDAACKARDGVQILAAEALGDGQTATTVRTRGGEVMVTDGPYAEAVEQLGGFYLLEAPDLDVVLDLLRRLPPYDIQINPIFTMD